MVSATGGRNRSSKWDTPICGYSKHHWKEYIYPGLVYTRVTLSIYLVCPGKRISVYCYGDFADQDVEIGLICRVLCMSIGSRLYQSNLLRSMIVVHSV